MALRLMTRKASSMKKWFEVFAANTTNPPYVLVLMAQDGDSQSFKVDNPKENDRLVEIFGDYLTVRNWLNQDDFYLVNGRQEMPY